MTPCPSCGLPYARTAPPSYVSIGNAWVRVAEIAAVTQWEIVLRNGGGTIPLGDDVEPDDVLGQLQAATEVPR